MKMHREQRKLEDHAALITVSRRGNDQPCPLCGRAMVNGDSLNVHHLIPRMFGGRQTAVIHKVCHAKIHSVFTEAELARWFHTFERLREHEEMARFIRWVRRQPPERIHKHARRRKL